MISAAGVIVPAHNEQSLLPDCLRALHTAAARAAVPTRIVVVADACTDDTAGLARAAGAHVVTIQARNVGVARAAGAESLLRRLAAAEPDGLWLATTDADTIVPADWLARQVDYADQGYDVVLGTVGVSAWDEHPPHVPAAFAARYAFGAGPHPHVHGANFGIRASAYQLAGGFRPLSSGEDHALRSAAVGSGCRVVHATDIEVITSARRQARASRGFGDLLNRLAAGEAEPDLTG